jgi:glycerol-3-phosphate O-acyltransferase/dihydroxyacetone phosphate acyltransferase
MRALFTAVCRLLLRIFFRRIDSVGAQRVPGEDSTPVLYVLNHPNALLDPLFILCLSPRPVTFLAKAPLFSTFLVKHFVRAFECLPVYRKQDGDDPSKNRASIEASIALLTSGKALALFPEGTSHSKPRLEPLKTGAARIALSASAATPERSSTPVLIVPVGLDYDDKTTFRSNARMIYGEPIPTPVVELDAAARPPAAAAEALTTRIAAALAEVTVQARTHEAVLLARSLARILAAAERDLEGLPGKAQDPLGGFDLERRLVAGYEHLREADPARLQAMVARVRAFADELARLGLPVDHPARLDRRRAARWTALRVASLLALFAPALVGVVVHFVPYRAIDRLAHRVARRQSGGGPGEDLLATLKLVAGLLFFPLTWIVVALTIGLAHRWASAAWALLLLPICAWAALRFVELLADFRERARGAWVLATRRDVGRYVSEERAAIRAEIVELARELEHT